MPFIEYAVRGFVDQLREQIDVIRVQQTDIAWINYVHDRFRGDKSESGRRRRALVLALSEIETPVKKVAMPKLTPDLAAAYARKTPKTVSRDLNALLELKLVSRSPEGYAAAKNRILAFLPIRTLSPRPKPKALKVGNANAKRQGASAIKDSSQLSLIV